MKGDSNEGDSPAVDPDVGTADGRKPWDWQTRFPLEARKQIRREAYYLAACLLFFGILSAFIASYSNATIDLELFCGPRDVSANAPLEYNCFITYFAGGLGGTVFSIKWLMHSVGTGKWHQDRIYWRVFVPLIGGVYAIMIHGLASSGLVGGNVDAAARGITTAASISFLVGYFSDGVSGLLTNIANAVFGTVIEKK
jgi:hypothetical protein